VGLKVPEYCLNSNRIAGRNVTIHVIWVTDLLTVEREALRSAYTFQTVLTGTVSADQNQSKSSNVKTYH